MNNYDAIVIGGGLLGCFAARSLTRYNMKVAMLEKREDLCTGISRANSAIIYSGCDTKPGSLKTDLCVRASQDFSRLCSELGVRYFKCGSIMVSFGSRGDDVLRRKLEQGTKNGVRDMKLLTGVQVLELEPNLASHVSGGLFIPETGTVMPWELCLAAAENAALNGADIRLNTEVVDIRRVGIGVEPNSFNEGRAASNDSDAQSLSPGYCIETNNGIFHAHAIVNCAGMNADHILGLTSAPTVKIVPTAGDYYILDTKAAGHIRHVIFHEPEIKGKGLTMVPTVEGNILVGPTDRPMTGEYETEKEGLDQISELVSEVIPSLPMDQIISYFGAVRPNPFIQLQNESGQWERQDRSVNDLCIVESDCGSMISLVGIKTPGLTCSNEIGEYVALKISSALEAGLNPGFNPKREAPLRVEELEPFELCELIRSRPEYGRIVCRCRGISEGEVVDAIRRSPGAVSLDGVKRRTGSDTGRCQGSFCSGRIIEILARELGVSVNEITKRGGESGILFDRI